MNEETKDSEHSKRGLSRRQILILSGAAVGALIIGTQLNKVLTSDEKERRDQLIDYQKFARPKIEKLLGAENYDRCCAAMLSEYDQIEPDFPVLVGKKNRSTFNASAPFMLTLYRTLLGEFGLSQDAALEMVGQITNYKVRKDWETRKATQFVLSRAAKSEFYRDLFLEGFNWEEGEEYGWAVEYPESDAYIAVNVTQCGLAKWFTDQGIPELAPVACEGDFVWAEFMTGLELQRTMTIAEGDEVCDFRYVKV